MLSLTTREALIIDIAEPGLISTGSSDAAKLGASSIHSNFLFIGKVITSPCLYVIGACSYDKSLNQSNHWCKVNKYIYIYTRKIVLERKMFVELEESQSRHILVKYQLHPFSVTLHTAQDTHCQIPTSDP